jgi:predicted nucleotidyltransferase
MHPLIESNRETIAELCRRHGVTRLEVFGSAVRDDFDLVRSDVDVLAEFNDETRASFGNYLDFKDALERLFGRSVDVICAGAVRNPYVRAEIERSKVPLYAA